MDCMKAFDHVSQGVIDGYIEELRNRQQRFKVDNELILGTHSKHQDETWTVKQFNTKRDSHVSEG